MIDLQEKHVLILGCQDAHTEGATHLLRRAGAHVAIRELEGIDIHEPEVLQEQLRELIFDVVILSPSWSQLSSFLDTPDTAWDEALARNVEQMTYALQAVARTLIARGLGGRIIILSSVVSLMPFTDTVAVGTSLAALRVLAKMAAVDLGPHEITVNTITAGWVEGSKNAQKLTPEGRAFVEAGIPLGRLGSPADVGGACLFLSSDLARYITGITLTVDGGYILTRADGESPYPWRNDA